MLCLAACSTPPAPPPPVAPTPAPVASTPPPPTCVTRKEPQTKTLKYLEDFVDSTKTPHPYNGYYHRYFPTLTEQSGGAVTGLVPTPMMGPFGRVYVAMLLIGENAYLAVASAPCADGDLAMIGKPFALDGKKAGIAVPRKIPRTELAQMEVLVNTDQTTPSLRFVVLAKGANGVEIVGAVDEVRETEPEHEVRHWEISQEGTGWLPYEDGMVYLWVHSPAWDSRSDCQKPKKERPRYPRSTTYTVQARINGKGEFSTRPADLPPASAVTKVPAHPKVEMVQAGCDESL